MQAAVGNFPVPLPPGVHVCLYVYLIDVSDNFTFATLILQVLIEERQTAYCNRLNSNNNITPFVIGNAVQTNVQIQSISKSGAVKELSLQAR